MNTVLDYLLGWVSTNSWRAKPVSLLSGRISSSCWSKSSSRQVHLAKGRWSYNCLSTKCTDKKDYFSQSRYSANRTSWWILVTDPVGPPSTNSSVAPRWATSTTLSWLQCCSQAPLRTCRFGSQKCPRHSILWKEALSVFYHKIHPKLPTHSHMFDLDEARGLLHSVWIVKKKWSCPSEAVKMFSSSIYRSSKVLEEDLTSTQINDALMQTLGCWSILGFLFAHSKTWIFSSKLTCGQEAV